MQGPGIQDLEVATVLDLVDLHVAPLTDGSTVYVLADKAQYRLDKNSGVEADFYDVVAPSSGSPIAGAANARWLRIAAPTTESSETFIGGAIGTYNVLDGSTNPRVQIPLAAGAQYTIKLAVRRDNDGALASYERVVTIGRDGAAAPVIVGSTDLVAHVQAVGTIPADWSFPATTIEQVGPLYFLVVQFAVANNVYTAITARATVTREPTVTVHS